MTISDIVIETSPDMRVAAREQPRPLAVPEGSGSITDLLFMAVQKGTPVAELKELVALHEHMSKRQAMQDFALALAAFQSECEEIQRNKTATIVTKTGGSYSFKYASLDEVSRTIRPILVKHGLSYSWDAKIERDVLTCICTVRHINGHSEPSSLTLPVENPSAMNPQQKVGAAYTFAQRRTLEAGLGLTTSEDTPDVKGADPTPITDDQRTVIEDLLVDRTKGKTDAAAASIRARFLNYMETDAIANIRAAGYEQAVSALQPPRGRS